MIMSVVLFIPTRKPFLTAQAGLGVPHTSQCRTQVGSTSVYVSAFPPGRTAGRAGAQPSLRATLNAGPPEGPRAVPQEPRAHLQPCFPPPRPGPWPRGALSSLTMSCFQIDCGYFLKCLRNLQNDMPRQVLTFCHFVCPKNLLSFAVGFFMALEVHSPVPTEPVCGFTGL